MRLLVDDREPQNLVNHLLAQVEVPIERTRLSIADFWVVNDGEQEPLCVVERKAWADLRASCIDGRFRSQRAKMASAFPNTRCVLLVESEEHDSRAKEDWNNPQFGQLNHRCESELLRATLFHADNMRLVRTYGHQHTCRVLMWICKELGKAYQGQLESVPDLEVANRARNAKKASKKSVGVVTTPEDHRMDRRAALLSIRGLSLPRVLAIEAVGRSLRSWGAAYHENREGTLKTLAAVPVGQKKLGAVLARRVLEMLTY